MKKIQATAAILLLLLGACSTIKTGPFDVPTSEVPSSDAVSGCADCPCPTCAAPAPSDAPVPLLPEVPSLQAASWGDLPGWQSDQLQGVWAAFKQSCASGRWKNSRRGPAAAAGNGRPAAPYDWWSVCEASLRLPGGDQPSPETLRDFFHSQFVPWAVTNPDGTREGTITGYYEPLLRGSRKREGPYRVPLYAVPDDLLTIELGDLFPELKHKRVRGRVEGNKVVPYYDRGGIRARAEELRNKVLAWADDPIEVFFLHIQGSGRVRLPDGSLMRVGYADQNGHPYQSIGRLLVERGELTLDKASMQGIQAWGRANPKKLDELLDSNPSFVFFRELPAGNDGPIGALGVPLTERRSLAVDPRIVPLGAPVFLATTEPNSSVPLNRLMFAQDTGGAIKGAVRGDFFWGFGPEAGAIAGRMRQSGRMWVLLPHSAVAPPLPPVARNETRSGG